METGINPPRYPLHKSSEEPTVPRKRFAVAISSNVIHLALDENAKISRIPEEVTVKKLGRPKGTKNKEKPVEPVIHSTVFKKRGRPKKVQDVQVSIVQSPIKQQPVEVDTVVKRRGRKKGSKNRPKIFDVIDLPTAIKVSLIEETPLASAIDYLEIHMSDTDRTFWVHEMTRRNMTMRQVLARYFLSQFRLTQINISHFK